MDERLRLFAENPIPRDDIPTLENQIGFGQKGDFKAKSNQQPRYRSRDIE